MEIIINFILHRYDISWQNIPSVNSDNMVCFMCMAKQSDCCWQLSNSDDNLELTKCNWDLMPLFENDRKLNVTDTEIHFSIKIIFPGIGIPIRNIKWLQDFLIFIMGIAILVKWHFCVEMAPVSIQEIYDLLRSGLWSKIHDKIYSIY